jgi:hypothetical protein
VSDCVSVCVCACMCVYNRNSVILQHAPIIVIVKERLDENYGKKNDEKLVIYVKVRGRVLNRCYCACGRGV